MADMQKFVPLWLMDGCELADDLDEANERDQGPCAVEALTKALGLSQGKKRKGACKHAIPKYGYLGILE